MGCIYCGKSLLTPLKVVHAQPCVIVPAGPRRYRVHQPAAWNFCLPHSCCETTGSEILMSRLGNTATSLGWKLQTHIYLSSNQGCFGGKGWVFLDRCKVSTPYGWLCWFRSRPPACHGMHKSQQDQQWLFHAWRLQVSHGIAFQHSLQSFSGFFPSLSHNDFTSMSFFTSVRSSLLPHPFYPNLPLESSVSISIHVCVELIWGLDHCTPSFLLRPLPH